MDYTIKDLYEYYIERFIFWWVFFFGSFNCIKRKMKNKIKKYVDLVLGQPLKHRVKVIKITIWFSLISFLPEPGHPTKTIFHKKYKLLKRNGQRWIQSARYERERGGKKGLTPIAAWPLPVPTSQAKEWWGVRAAIIEYQSLG